MCHAVLLLTVLDPPHVIENKTLNKYKREISLDRLLIFNAQLTTRERERGQTNIFFRRLVLKALAYDRYGQTKEGTGRNTMIASLSGPFSVNAD